MTTAEIAALATPPAIKIWNKLPEAVRAKALETFKTKEEAIAELAMSLIRKVASKLSKA